MSFKTILAAAVLAVLPATSFAADIIIKDAYARASSPAAKAGAAFMTIHNATDHDDHLIAVASGVSQLTQFHTHEDAGGGVLKMREVEGGFMIKAGETLTFSRGGNHVMFLGLNDSLEQDEIVSVTLTFEKAGELVVDIPVDLERKPAGDHGKAADHGAHGDHGKTSGHDAHADHGTHNDS
ncbi:MAG: copper chaperone PCu(A)C [Litoreibacter sp.]